MGVTHDRVGVPFTCTVHAPHCATPQPNLVPVSPSSSRTTQSSGASPGCSECASLPLTVNLTIVFPPQESTSYSENLCLGTPPQPRAQRPKQNNQSRRRAAA